jgi:hypothetical protein
MSTPADLLYDWGWGSKLRVPLGSPYPGPRELKGASTHFNFWGFQYSKINNNDKNDSTKLPNWPFQKFFKVTLLIYTETQCNIDIIHKLWLKHMNHRAQLLVPMLKTGVECLLSLELSVSLWNSRTNPILNFIWKVKCLPLRPLLNLESLGQMHWEAPGSPLGPLFLMEESHICTPGNFPWVTESRSLSSG